jgi:hypothetical protein
MDNIDTNMPYPKISKCTSGYVEEESFNNPNLGTGYFCNNCTYFINDKQCAIVKDSGPDVNGKESGIIAPYGSCDLWVPNKEVESDGATKKSI